MLPILWNITLPAAWVKPTAAAMLLAVALLRPWFLRRRERRGGRAISWGRALWEDRAILGLLLGAAGLAWAGGYLDRDLHLPVHTYGVALATGFVAAIALAQHQARRVGQDAERIGALAFWVLLSALVGSRVYYVLVSWTDYFGEGTWLLNTRLGRIPRVLAFWEGGLVFYGGFIAATAASFIYLRHYRMRFLPYADTIIPSVALGHFFGRLGCFAAGCCWGSVSDLHLPWLVRFPPESLAYQSLTGRIQPARFLEPHRLTTLPLHPVQLYEALGELAIFVVLVLARRSKRFDGQILALWLGL